MEIVAVISRKGGVGKTATVQALGAGLRRDGYKVLYIDLDSQTNLTYGLAADPEGVTVADVLNGKATAADAIQHTEQGDILAGSDELALADMTMQGKAHEYLLKKAIKGLQYDYIVIDTPAQLGILTINALSAANSIVIPVQAEIYSLQGMGQLHRIISTVQHSCNSGLYIRGILITRYNGRAIISRDMQSNLEQAADFMHTQLYKTPIRECVSIKEAQASQQDIFKYAPHSNAAKDYNAFIDDFMKGGTPGKQ